MLLFRMSIDTARRFHGNQRQSDAVGSVDIWSGVVDRRRRRQPPSAPPAGPPLYGLLKGAVKVIKDPHGRKS